MASPNLEITNADDTHMAELRSHLFQSAMKGEWEKVVEIYRKNPEAYGAEITKSGDTALHLAVRDGQEETVLAMVEAMTSKNLEEAKKALSIGNDHKNTALHIAAFIGNVAMCSCIAGVDSSLVGIPNEDMETPFYWAALFGRRDAFLRLHRICSQQQRQSYSRNKKDGETILHAAIKGEFFDLAFQIINLYGDLADSWSVEGMTPLHLLAARPNAFRSGAHLSGYRKLIYYCIFVDKVEVEKTHDPTVESTAPSKNDKPPAAYPQNYETCLSFCRLLRKFIEFGVYNNYLRKYICNLIPRSRPRSQGDAENQKGDNLFTNASAVPTPSKNEKTAAYPQNDDETCLNFCRQLKKLLEFALNLIRRAPQGSQGNAENQNDKRSEEQAVTRHPSVPLNYNTCFDILKFVSKALLVVLGLGSSEIRKLEEKKKKHTWSVQILDELLARIVMYQYVGEGGKQPLRPVELPDDHSLNEIIKTNTTTEETTAILIAAKNGITEIVEKILEKYPVAIYDMDSKKKNIMLLAVENRQPCVYELLLKRRVMRDSIFRKVDANGNSALHLSAGLINSKQPWRIPGAALQMQWEFKWFEYIKNSMPPHFFIHRNKNNQTPKDIFTETHQQLVRDGGQWLTNTSQSCSVVAALIATVAFATSATVPGGVNEEKGTPTLERHPAFNAFAISSLVALCFSVTSVVLFLSILTSRYQERDFYKDLPTKLLVGLSSLFISIAAILVSFCAGHFFVLKDELQYAALPIYAVTCLPVTLFAIAQFPLYFDLIWAMFKKVPQRSFIVIDN